MIAPTATLFRIGLAVRSGGTDIRDSGDTVGAAKTGEPVQIEHTHRRGDVGGMTKLSEVTDQWNEHHPDIRIKAAKLVGEARATLAG